VVPASRHGEVIEVDSPTGKKRFKIIETPIDPPLTVKRELVPVETTEDDIPIGSRLLDERETDGHLARSSRPERFTVGELVRLKENLGEMPSEITGTIDAKLKGDKFRVRWSNGTVERYEAKQLTHIW
jgi:hypothetical protein